MDSFAKDLNELIILSNSLCVGQIPLISAQEFIKRLKSFEDNCQTNSTGNALNLKFRLLANLMFIVRSVTKSNDKYTIINCMKILLKDLVIDDIEFFILLYNSVFHQIYEQQDVPLSEEIKLAVLECSIELIKRSTKRLFQLLYSVEYGAKFSMGILIAVTIAKEEKSIKLRTTALDFLLVAMQHHRKHDKVLEAGVGNLFMLYLPGIIGRLHEIICRDETQTHVITSKAITCWGQLLCTVMHDLDSEENLSDAEYIKKWMNLSKESITGQAKNLNVNNALQEKSRSLSWLQAAAETLRPLLLKIPSVRNHSHPKVRLEITLQTARLLENCLINLKPVVNVLLEVLISSSEDEDEEVREAADMSIIRFQNRCREKNGQIYFNVIEDHLNSLINKMPNVIYLRDDKSILNAVQSLCGNFKILLNSGKLGQIICFSSNITRLVRLLVLISRLESYPEIAVQDYSVWDNDVSSTNWTKEWKRFKHFTDVKIMNKLVNICGLMGQSGELETILDFLFEKFKEDDSCRNEILFIINEVVGGSSHIPDNVVKQFLDLYLDPHNLYLTLEVDGDACKTVPSSRNNIITVSLLMEGVGKLARVIGKKFNDYLLKSLYYIVEKIGSSFRILRTCAMTAGVLISEAVGLNGNIEALIQNNVDYLTFHITIKLRRDHAGVFDVVRTVMKNSPFEAVTNLEEIINNVLKSSSEKFESRHTISYLRLFQTFVLCVNKWLKNSDVTSDCERNDLEMNGNKKSDFDSLLEYITEMENKRTEDINDEESRNENETTANDNDQDESSDYETLDKKSKSLPKHIQLTILIAENALHYLPSKDLNKKLIVLEILNESVWILADRENELLPLVHKIWSPLVNGFEKITDPLVINRSFTLLYSMSRTSKDFIRRRTLKNVLPALWEFLFKATEKSKLKDSGTGYHYTQNFKLQKELLSKLGVLATDLRLTGKELDCVVECSLPYLSSSQPPPLQESSRKLLLDFKYYDPYLIWYKLHVLKDNPDYSKNAEIILSTILS